MTISKRKKGVHNRKYSDSFKRQVVADYQRGEETVSSLAKRYGIPGKSMIYKFVEWFNGLPENQGPPAPAPLSDTEKQDNEALRKRNAELEQLLEQERLRSLGYSTMIGIAEKELGIEIRKKSDTKQWKP